MFDGEFVFSHSPSRPHTYLAYDCVMYDGVPCNRDTLVNRLANITKAVTLFRAAVARQGATFSPVFTFLGKTFKPKNEVASLLTCISSEHGKRVYREVRNGASRANYNDGLIFTPNDGGYMAPILKFKWIEKQTVDFAAGRITSLPSSSSSLSSANNSSKGVLHEVELSCNGVNKPITTAVVSDQQLAEVKERLRQGNIVECRYLRDQGFWDIVGFRPDKTVANYITTVFDTLLCIVDDIREQDLVEACKQP